MEFAITFPELCFLIKRCWTGEWITPHAILHGYVPNLTRCLEKYKKLKNCNRSLCKLEFFKIAHTHMFILSTYT